MTGRIRRILVLAVMVTVALGGLSGSAQAVSVTVTGPEEVAWDWDTMRCADYDWPDGPVQAFRDSLGRLQLVAPFLRMIGTSFADLTTDCSPQLPITLDPNPAHYDYIHWLNGIYTVNGRDVYALLHNEWHGWEIPGACPSAGKGRRCGVGAVTYAVSHDNGDTWVSPAPPDNFVATVPPRPVIDDPRTGLFAPSAPVKKGSYYYTFALIGASEEQEPGACVLRSPDLTDPHSWRGWDGASFSVRFKNPYYENASPQRTHLCEPMDFDSIQAMTRSVTYNTFLGKYVLTGDAAKFDPVQSKTVHAFYFSTSDDLIHWSMRQLLYDVPTVQSHQCGGPDAGAYPALIDHDSTDRNYRTTDATAYLYFTRIHYNAACQSDQQNDLIRVPVQFSP
jgi:hypothetical protein